METKKIVFTAVSAFAAAMIVRCHDKAKNKKEIGKIRGALEELAGQISDLECGLAGMEGPGAGFEDYLFEEECGDEE